MRRTLPILLCIAVASASLFAGPSFKPFIETEQGAIAILSHTYQNGNFKDENPTFDFVKQGSSSLFVKKEGPCFEVIIVHPHKVDNISIFSPDSIDSSAGRLYITDRLIFQPFIMIA